MCAGFSFFFFFFLFLSAGLELAPNGFYLLYWWAIVLGEISVTPASKSGPAKSDEINIFLLPQNNNTNQMAGAATRSV